MTSPRTEPLPKVLQASTSSCSQEGGGGGGAQRQASTEAGLPAGGTRARGQTPPPPPPGVLFSLKTPTSVVLPAPLLPMITVSLFASICVYQQAWAAAG